MKDKNLVSVSPHISSPVTTKNIMLDVIIALLPATVAAVLVFGLYPLVVILLAVLGSVGGEYIFNKITRSNNTLSDLSAVVTGLLLGLNLPPVLPLYVPIVGGLFAAIIVKMLFGGIGKNFANPAITARIFLVLAWGGLMTTFVRPIDLSEGFSSLFTYFNNIDTIEITGATPIIEGVTSATPLAYINQGDLTNVSLLDLFLGRTAGCAGEVSALALIMGGIYLAIKRVIDIKIPVIFIATVMLFTLIFTGNYELMLPAVLSGGIMIGAIFMATDYATTPNSALGKIIFAFGCGFITIIIRVYGNLPEGVSFAILFMNIITPLLDKYIIPKPFGYIKVKKAKRGGDNV